MRILLPVLAAFSWVASVRALQESEAGVVDWHKSFIGVPRTNSPRSSPVFHRIHSFNSTRSVVLTTTENTNVLAALDPADGSIAWRYIFEPNDQILSFQRHKNVVAALSGIGGSHLRVFDSTDGDLILEKKLHSHRTDRLSEPRQLGVSVAFATDGSLNMFVLTNGHTLYHMNAAGGIKWAWTSPDNASLVIYERVIVSDTTIYVVGLAKSVPSYTLHVAAISAATGELLTSTSLPSNIANEPEDFLFLTKATEENPHLIWLEKGVVKYVSLTPKLGNKPSSIPGSDYDQILDLGLCDKGFFVARKTDGSSYVFKFEGNKVQQSWEFAGSATNTASTDSLYTGSVDKDGNTYIGRLYWSHTSQASTLHVYAPHLLDGQGMVSGFSFPFETNTHGMINHFALDVVILERIKVLARVVLTTSTGAVQLWMDDKVQWTREEGLSEILLAELVELPEKKAITSLGSEEGESFLHRLLRHASDAQNLPQYLMAFVKRFATGSYASVTSVASAHSSGLSSRDDFGFKKMIVAANGYGKLYGIDSSNGNITWSRVLGLGPVAQIGGKIHPSKMFVTRAVSDGNSPQIVLVAKRQSNDGVTDTVVFHFNPLTGEDVLRRSVEGDVLQGTDVFKGYPLDAYMLEWCNKTVVLVDELHQLHLYPNTVDDAQSFNQAASSIYFALQMGDHGIQGFQVLPSSKPTGVFTTFSAWSLSVPESEVIQSIVRPPKGPVASLGKVLGNRTTLYKYLNPHLFAVTTVPKNPSRYCSVYLVDGVKGSILYHVSLTSKGPCSLNALLVENWLVYSYYDVEYAGSGQTKGYRVVSVEIYEGKTVDDKIRSSEMSSFSNKTSEIQTLENAFGTLHGIDTMAFTSTKFGMTTKDIIAATKNNQIQSIPRRILDPRRPKSKPTAEEQEEMLIQYDPNLPADPRLIISHNYKVANVRKIITSPALLESTSLVFAFGIDLFFTRVSPSNTFDILNEGFNKLQLVLTVGGLVAAIGVTGPMMRKKMLKERWYQ